MSFLVDNGIQWEGVMWYNLLPGTGVLLASGTGL